MTAREIGGGGGWPSGRPPPPGQPSRIALRHGRRPPRDSAAISSLGCVVALGRLARVARPRTARAGARRRPASTGPGPLGSAESPRGSGGPYWRRVGSFSRPPPATRSRLTAEQSKTKSAAASSAPIDAPSVILPLFFRRERKELLEEHASFVEGCSDDWPRPSPCTGFHLAMHVQF